MTPKIPRRVSSALLGSLAGGVVPRVGLEHIAVGRKPEITALLSDLETVESGGSTFRVVAGRYGSGKSFLLQLLRNNALERGFVVADADLSPERRLIGANGQGVATYRELLANLSIKARQDGGAISSVLEKWISDIQLSVARAGIAPGSAEFAGEVERAVHAETGKLHYMVNGFDFASAVTAYWRGHEAGDEARQDAALRWLRGEYATKTDSLKGVGIRSIIDDDNWYDQLKSLAMFFTDVGYKGLIVVIDEAVNLFKITHAVARQQNYERLLSIFNDTMQGKARSIGFVFGSTLESVEDPRRGLYSYDALRSRLGGNRFTEQGFFDNSTPVLRLRPLSAEEIFVLLRRVGDVHAAQYPEARVLSDADREAFIRAAVARVGSDVLATPREFVRDYVGMLSVLRQNPDVDFARLLGETPIGAPATAGDDRFADFEL